MAQLMRTRKFSNIFFFDVQKSTIPQKNPNWNKYFQCRNLQEQVTKSQQLFSPSFSFYAGCNFHLYLGKTFIYSNTPGKTVIFIDFLKLFFEQRLVLVKPPKVTFLQNNTLSIYLKRILKSIGIQIWRRSQTTLTKRGGLALVTQPMLQHRPNWTELRSMDSYIQI